MGPWTREEIDKARSAPIKSVLDQIGCYYKVDRDYRPRDPSQRRLRYQVNYEGRDYRIIVNAQKWVDELEGGGSHHRGGGGAIDFVKYLTRSNFVQAVKICLEALNRSEGR